ncbi:hypothetical protein L1987_57826 [Smallanthus sonchifolius]|uniref:Uncharacterized protein n=1 Tax=Smallanthus sonchifolius TaxID=185202 RepID=A0ACB9DDX8_9ASTR|nr:hypothetical protein L1987_57826 [Smallanthus sonchifolius]
MVICRAVLSGFDSSGTVEMVSVSSSSSAISPNACNSRLLSSLSAASFTGVGENVDGEDSKTNSHEDLLLKVNQVQDSSIPAHVYEHLCSNECIAKVLKYRGINDLLIAEKDTIKKINDEMKKNELAYKRKSSQSRTDDSSADVSETVKTNEVCDVDDVTVGLGFSGKDFIHIKFMKKGTIQQQSGNALKERPKVFKNDDYVGSRVILQDDDSSDELKIKKEDAIHIHTTEKLPSPWNMDKVVARLKNKKEGHSINHCKQVDETSSSTSRRHDPDVKGNKNCFFGSK